MGVGPPALRGGGVMPRAPLDTRFRFAGSHGVVMADPFGVAVFATKCTCEPGCRGYEDVKAFNLGEWAAFHHRLGNCAPKEDDILAVGFWTRDGQYTPPEESARRDYVPAKREPKTSPRVVEVLCPTCDGSGRQGNCATTLRTPLAPGSFDEALYLIGVHAIALREKEDVCSMGGRRNCEVCAALESDLARAIRRAKAIGESLAVPR